jgi:predicted lipoprotein with Yx(FWY)xxD motif
MRHFQIRALATVAVAAFALAACGSSSKASSPDTTAAPATTAVPATTAAPAPTAAPAAAATVKLAATTKLGKVLVDAKGRTLYRFDNDTTAGKSTCGTGQCASTWPAATVTGTPVPGAGVSNLTTFSRADDGKTQLQIGGHPLYTFAGDSKPGDTNGQGIINKWYAVNGTGAKVGDAS